MKASIRVFRDEFFNAKGYKNEIEMSQFEVLKFNLNLLRSNRS